MSFIASPYTSIPYVFVFPPPEDDELPYCCFNAEQPLGDDQDDDVDYPQSHYIDSPFPDSPESPPTFHRHSALNGVTMPRKYVHPSSGTDSLDSDSDEEDDDYGEEDITIRGNQPGDDSEIIEVIKVKRNQHPPPDQHPPPLTTTPSHPNPMKPSKTFKARAAMAFRSIKNVASVSRSKSTDVFSANPSDTGTVASRASTTSYRSQRSRRGSFISQIFSPMPRSTADYDPSPPPSIHSIQSSSLSLSEIDTPVATSDPSQTPQQARSRHAEDLSTSPYMFSTQTDIHPSSPSLASRRRFSVLDLFTSANTPPTATVSRESIAPMMSRESLGPSTSSTDSWPSGPPTPTDTIAPAIHAPAAITKTSFLRRLPSFNRKDRRHNTPPGEQHGGGMMPHANEDAVLVDVGDVSFELRLDSLHFDGLSFDADNF